MFSSQPMWDITIHPLSGPASSLALVPFSNWCRIATKSTLLGAQRLYWHTILCLPPFGEQREGWHIVQCLALIPFLESEKSMFWNFRIRCWRASEWCSITTLSYSWITKRIYAFCFLNTRVGKSAYGNWTNRRIFFQIRKPWLNKWPPATNFPQIQKMRCMSKIKGDKIIIQSLHQPMVNNSEVRSRQRSHSKTIHYDRKNFDTLIRNVSFSPPIDVRSHI